MCGKPNPHIVFSIVSFRSPPLSPPDGIAIQHANDIKGAEQGGGGSLRENSIRNDSIAERHSIR